MSNDLDPLLKRLNLANTRRVWQDVIARAEKEEWTHEQLLLTLFSEEIAHRRGTRLNHAVRAAEFPFLRSIEEFDFTYQSTLRLTSVGSLLSPDFVTEGRSVILHGKPGRGKTHLAIAIAYRALQNGFEAVFTTAAELIDDLSSAGRAGSLRTALARYVQPHVLVIDEVGYLTYGSDAANVLYNVVNERHVRRRSMIFTTNKLPSAWGPVLHDDDLADAIVDRILERGRLLRLDGPSVRTKHLPQDEQPDHDHDEERGSKLSGKPAADFPELPNGNQGTQKPISVGTTVKSTDQTWSGRFAGIDLDAGGAGVGAVGRGVSRSGPSSPRASMRRTLLAEIANPARARMFAMRRRPNDQRDEVWELVDGRPGRQQRVVAALGALRPIRDRRGRDLEASRRLVRGPAAGGPQREDQQALLGRVVRPMLGRHARRACVANGELLSEQLELRAHRRRVALRAHGRDAAVRRPPARRDRRTVCERGRVQEGRVDAVGPVARQGHVDALARSHGASVPATHRPDVARGAGATVPHPAGQ